MSGGSGGSGLRPARLGAPAGWAPQSQWVARLHWGAWGMLGANTCPQVQLL